MGDYYLCIVVVMENYQNKQRGKGWLIYFILLGLFNINTVVSLVGLLWLSKQAASGDSGTEFIALIFLPGLYGGIVPAILNVLTIPIYLIKHQKGVIIWLFCGGIIILSIGYLVWAIPGAIKDSQAHKDFPKLQQQAKAQFEVRQQQFNQSTAPKELTISEATDMLNNCQIHQFYEMPNASINPRENAEKSSTGIYLVSLPNTGPWRMTISSTLDSKLTPIAEAAKAKCGFPAIDNDY